VCSSPSTRTLPIARWRCAVAAALLCLGLATGADTRAQPTFTVTVGGNVAQALSLTVSDLKRYPAHQVDYAATRDSHQQNGTGAVRHYTGCLLRDLLAAAQPVERHPRDLRKSYVVATASDGYEVVFSWAELFISPIGDAAFVVYERDGTPLADDEGRIALIVTADMRPVRHVKWLKSLTLQGS
jgi:DMSO/TMAO reductase YedYZ molybdopterin-dependent catalytic subunit